MFEVLNLRVLTFDLVMLLEKFIQQHGVDRFVTDAVNLVPVVPHHQIRVHLVNVLRDEAILRVPLGSMAGLYLKVTGRKAYSASLSLAMLLIPVLNRAEEVIVPRCPEHPHKRHTLSAGQRAAQMPAMW